MAMGPILGSGRRGRRAPMSEINVTPMVDVMLVLLIIFMVTAPLLTAGVQVDLPESQAKSIEQDKEPLTVSVNDKGQVFLQNTEIAVEELVPKLVSVGDVQRVLRQLLRERVPVRDLMTILEALADAAAVSKDLDVHVESVRTALGRAVCRPYQAENGDLTVLSVSPALEDTLLASMTRTDRGTVLALDPARAQALASKLGEALATEDLAQPVLLCSPMLRPHLWRLFSRALPHVVVLSHAEVPAQVRVVSVATLA